VKPCVVCRYRLRSVCRSCLDSEAMYCLSLQAKISSDPEQYVAAPAGVQFHEVTAGGLVKVNSSGSLTDSGSMSLAPTKATFSLAMAMHAALADVKSVVFLCNPSAVSVSISGCLLHYWFDMCD